MKKIIYPIAFLLTFAIPVWAQQQDFTLKVTNDDVNTIGKALGKLPFDDVAGLIQKLREQIVSQQQKSVEAPIVAPAPPKPKE